MPVESGVNSSGGDVAARASLKPAGVLDLIRQNLRDTHSRHLMVFLKIAL